MDSMNIHPKVVKTVNHDREIVKLYGAEHQNTMQAFITCL